MLAPASVIHTQRWVEALYGRGIDLLLVSQHIDTGWKAPPSVRLVQLPHVGTAGYFCNVPTFRRLLRKERPDLLSVHYASGYGTTAALAGFHPWLLSVWGSDVYDFPYESRLKGWLLRRNLRHADAVASTSDAMARQVLNLVGEIGEVAVTPFGVDTALFKPQPESHAGLVIGTVKTLAPKYGIDLLVRAFARLVESRNPSDVPLSLVIVGGGEQRGELESLCTTLGIAQQVHFVGPVPHSEVPIWLNRFDIYVAVSRLDSESFGVAVLEASACGLPVVVSDVGGLPEVVVDRESGRVVPREDASALTAVLRELVNDSEQCRRLGGGGRMRVEQHYEWRQAVDRMLGCFDALVARGVGR